MKRFVSRRAIMMGLGLGAFALPFIKPRVARAAQPKRLVIVTSSNGTVMEEFFPGANNSYKQILSPLEPLKHKLLVMRGVDMKSAYKTPVPKDHLPDNLNMLTGRQAVETNGVQPAGISIDQHIANAIGNQTKFASLQLGVMVGGYAGIISSRGASQGVSPESNPYKAFTRLFADVTGNTGELDRLRARKKSILDAVAGDLGELECELSTEDRPRLQAHLESIREIERGLDISVGTGCKPPVQTAGTPINDANFPALTKLQMDIVAAALACDLTRVITLQLKNGSSGVQHRWLGIEGTHHGISHGSEGVTADEPTRRGWLIQIERWHAEQFFYLINALEKIVTADGPLLDSTAVIWAHEQSNGGSHKRTDMPYVLAGSLGGQIRLGRAVHYNGAAHNGLLISLANYMGVPTDAFGDPDFSAGPLADF